MRIAYIPSETAVPPAHAFAFPIRKRMFQPGIYCIPNGRGFLKETKKPGKQKKEKIYTAEYRGEQNNLGLDIPST